MKLPYPKFLDKVHVTISLTDGNDNQGVPVVVETIETKCTFNEYIQHKKSVDGSIVIVVGKVLIGGDIAESIAWLEGYLVINSKTYLIHKGIRTRNPDGSVHHTELELM